MTALEVRRERLNEAKRVREAYDVVTGRLRGAWRSAKPGPDAERARRKLSLALEQARAAKTAEDAAWLDLAPVNHG
jgi:hypothetical protein